MERDFWQKKWAESETPWDTKGANPLLAPLLALAQERAGLLTGQRIFVPGCGHGHDAFALAEAGYQVDAFDFVPEALAVASALYQHPRLHFALGDALEPVAPSDQGRHDACFDRAMLVALKPELRQAYMQAVASRLKPGGLFLGILFSAPEGRSIPPFAIGLKAMQQLCHKDFTLLALREVGSSALFSDLEETLHIWRKT